MAKTSALIRVLVVDDSPMIRSLLRSGLAQNPLIEVVGVASDGIEALAQIKALRPDVVTLDVEMPKMNGIAVLERVVGKAPVSFVMVSTLTQSGARITFEALNKGAIDYVAKPQAATKTAMPAFRDELIRKVIAAAKARGKRRAIVSGTSGAVPTLPPNKVRGWLVALGISCGGPQTLHKLLPAFPSDFVPIVLTQHMPPQFTTAFAKHLDAACAMRVVEAADGQPIEQGTIYVAPGDYHLQVVRRGTMLVTRLDGGPLVSGHRPSADVMFSSVARTCGPRSVAVVMTGMGRDGSMGLVEMSRAGAHTIAQDAETSYVYGMPKAAKETGHVDHVTPLMQIPSVLARLLSSPRRKPQAAR
jgi:two-component system chemotaxis response regulator CheB